jgi:DNA-binding NarL/FixJ family response regulator
MGKTRLLEEIATLATEDDWTVAHGHPAEIGSLPTQGLLVDALDDHLESDRLKAINDRLPGGMDLLATVFPAIGEPAAPATPPLEPYRIHRALRALLCILAGHMGLALLLDDIHRADTFTIAAVDYLLRHPPHAPVLMVVAYRPRQASPRLVGPLLAAAREGTVHRTILRPLTAQEAEPLLDPRMLRSQRDLAYRRSGGNPTYLEILTAASLHRGGSANGWVSEELPPLLAAPLLVDLHALTAQGRVVASAAAVVGDPFDPHLVADVAEVDPTVALHAIDEMLQTDLIRPVGPAQQFRFRHPLVRQVAYQSANGGWRLGAHARAAAALAERHAPLTALARHVRRAAPPGDAVSCQVLVDAATSVLRTEPGQAVTWLTAALDLLGEHSDVRPRRLQILHLLASALIGCGRLDEARQRLAELLADPAAPDRASALIRATEIDLLRGRCGGARHQLRAELATVDAGGPAPVGLLLGLCTAALHEDRPDLATIERAAAAVAPDAPAPVRAEAAAVYAAACGAAGRPEAASAADLAAELVDGIGDDALGAHPWTLIWLARAELDLDRLELARVHAGRGATIAAGAGHRHLLPYLLAAATEAHVRLGRLVDAMACAEQLDDLLAGIGQPALLYAAHFALRSRIAAEAGDAGEAVAAARRGINLAGALSGRLARDTMLAHGQALIAEGRWEQATRALLDAGGGPDLPMVWASARDVGFAELIRADLARGHPARGWLARAESLGGGELPGRRARLLLASARVGLRASPRQAAAAAREAAELFTQTGERIEAGRAMLLAAVALASAGYAHVAQTTRAEAITVLAACGAESLVALLDEEHRLILDSPEDLGEANLLEMPPRDPPPTPAAHPEFTALSERERQIAELVSHGHTNRQIARLLSLSHKTVETYLARIFAKLGVSSRASVATLVGCGVLGAQEGAGQPYQCTHRQCNHPAA